jgi:hypothetical protein
MLSMSRRSRSRRNPLGLSNKQLAVAGVATAGVVGGLAYILKRKSAAAAVSSCWKPAPTPFTLVPGHYRVEIPIPADQQASVSSQVAQLIAQLPALQQQLPGLTIEGLWAGGQSYPAGTPLPSDWPSAAAPAGVARIQLLNAYNGAGASSGLSPSTSIWVCSTGPVPAAQALPSNIASILASLASAAGAKAPATSSPPAAPVGLVPLYPVAAGVYHAYPSAPPAQTPAGTPLSGPGAHAAGIW